MRRLEDLQTHGLKFIQDTDLFLFGMDGVELANFAAPSPRTRVCDLGAGTGIIAVLLAGKYGCSVTAVEIQDACCKLIEENAAINGLDIKVAHMPMQEFCGSFDCVVCNPPYFKTDSGAPRATDAERIACFEEKVTLEEVCAAAARLLSTGGKLYMVHHITRLSEVLCALSAHKLEPKKLQILRPAPHKPPHLFEVECRKDGKSGIVVLPEKTI